jgi:alkylation response protein AidB-like acyl-CoA dehydrogenase
MTESIPALEAFLADAEAWLDDHTTRTVTADDQKLVWGQGEFSVSVFHALSHEDERELLERAKAWTQAKAERGYHAIAAPIEDGGLGYPRRYASAFGRLERQYDRPASHETHSVTTRLIAPTIQQWGTPDQRAGLVPRFLAACELCCQLFSEPGAGSDLASVSCRAVRDGDEWIVNGQKVWSSGAQFSQWGELIARTDVDVPKHRGLTAFVIPMDLPGIQVRPIKQMSGGASFNEVFFTDVRIADSMRLGAEGAGWRVALTTLGFERDHSDSGGGSRVGGGWQQLLATARARCEPSESSGERATRCGVTGDPATRRMLVDAYIGSRVETLVNRRAAELARGGTPGPEGSLGKLIWTEGMRRTSDVVSRVLGPTLIADTGEWGTYEWGERVLGAPGYRIAGGSDEVQRNIIGERVLGLPAEPRVDKDTPFKDVLR